jgi:HEAT repeat protein
MANKRRILTVTLLIAVLGFASWLILSQHDPEPIYKGKPLSYWCEQCVESYSPDIDIEMHERAETAIQAIGTNAVPTLVRMLRAKDSKFELRLIRLASKQHVVNIRWKTAEIRRYEAIQGLLALGGLAKSAVPALIQDYNERLPDPYDCVEIARIFALMGPAATEAVPLGQIHARPDLTVPALTKSLHDPIDVVRGVAATSLAAFGTDAKSAVPELIKLLADPSPFAREQAASALQKIDPEAAANAGVK